MHKEEPHLRLLFAVSVFDYAGGLAGGSSKKVRRGNLL